MVLTFVLAAAAAWELWQFSTEVKQQREQIDERIEPADRQRLEQILKEKARGAAESR